MKKKLAMFRGVEAGYPVIIFCFFAIRTRVMKTLFCVEPAWAFMA
jgi:hypothetical protein